MAEVNDQFDKVLSGLTALQAIQDQYDDQMWDINEPAFEKLRHIHIHLSSTVGKLARILEPADHSLYHDETVDLADMRETLEPVLADLLIHATQIANAMSCELPAALRARYRRNATRFAPDSEFVSI